MGIAEEAGKRENGPESTMENSSFHAEITDGLAGLVRFQFEGNTNQQAGLQSIVANFDRLLMEGRRNFVFDLQNVPLPSNSFIAFLVSSSLRARNMRGDVKLVNVSNSAKNNLLTFSSLTYLSLAESEEEAEHSLLMSLDESDADPPGKAVARQETPKGRPSDEGDLYARGNIAIREETPDTSLLHLRVESVASNLYRLCDFVTAHARQAGMDEREVGKIKIAVYEACINVIEHAYHSNPNYWIELSVKYDDELFTIIIEDKGVPFEMPKFKEYSVEEAMQNRRTGGFGLHIIRRATDEVEYKSDPATGNRLTMVKRLR
jgi:serine/threonine-protein kinase RsbW